LCSVSLLRITVVSIAVLSISPLVDQNCDVFQCTSACRHFGESAKGVLSSLRLDGTASYYV
jgi:hypothetical protein